MSPFDKKIVVRKAKLIEEDLAKLKEFQDISLVEYKKSFAVRLQVERLLERIIGRVIDVNYHILKEEFNLIPNDYYQSFTLLAERNIFDKRFADRISKSTGLRNALAHEYDEIDDTQVYASIKNCFSQVPQYLKKILEKYSK